MDKFKISLLDLFMVFIISTSSISILMLILSIYNILIVLTISLIITVLFLIMNFESFKLREALEYKEVLYLFVLLLIGILFRIEPYNYIVGGQDQGVYVNVSKHYENNGGISITDKIRQDLPDKLKESYDVTNLKLLDDNNELWHANEFEGYYLPGVYLKDQKKSEYVFQFYPLHPIWLSIFGKVFGDDERIYSLVFFSILSILAFFYLALEITSNKYAAYGAAVLLAINPLHVYFSKFPVTEVIALAFVLFSFLYLIKFYKSYIYEREQKLLYLILSSLLIGCMFFTRISGFMYIPFFFLILIASELFSKDHKLTAYIRWYVLSIFAIYALSVWYGMVFSYPYSVYIYNYAFLGVFMNNAYIKIMFVILIILFVYFVVITAKRSKYIETIREFFIYSKAYIPYIYGIILIVGMFKVYQLGFTEKYIQNPFINGRWNASGTEWNAVLYWSIFVVIEYISPFIFMAFSYVIYKQSKDFDAIKTYANIFLLMFWFHISILLWFVAYQYYYSRYLLSEVIPFILLITIAGVVELRRYQRLAIIFILLGAAYMLSITLTQFKGREMEGYQESLSAIESHVKPDDILLLDNEVLNVGGDIKTPLRFYYNYNVITVNNTNRRDFMDHYCQDKDVYYLSSSNKRYEYSRLEEAIELKVELFEHKNFTPVNIVKHTGRLYLHKVQCDSYTDAKMKREYLIYEKGRTVGQISGIHRDNVWTMGYFKLDKIHTKVDDNKYLILSTYGYPLKNHVLENGGIEIGINGQLYTFNLLDNDRYYIELPEVNIVESIEIISKTFNPKGMGLSNDDRDLGVDIKLIKLSKEIK